MAHPYDGFWPHKHTAHLIAKQFMFGTDLGQTFTYSKLGNWWLSEDGNDVPIEHEEVLEHFYQFLLSRGLLTYSTQQERIETVEEVEMAARQISIDRQKESLK